MDHFYSSRRQFEPLDIQDRCSWEIPHFAAKALARRALFSVFVPGAGQSRDEDHYGLIPCLWFRAASRHWVDWVDQFQSHPLAIPLEQDLGKCELCAEVGDGMKG